jgi:hypothetical protein
MYMTRAATQAEVAEMRKSIPSPLGHTVTGYDEQFRPAIETCSEVRIQRDERVKYVRRKMPNGKYIYRAITSHGAAG